MLGIKGFLLILIVVSVTARTDKRLVDRSWARRLLDELENEQPDEQNEERRNHENEDNDDSEDQGSSGNLAQSDPDEEEYLELRTKAASKAANTGPVITLQNHALMNTRLRVLYTDANSTPFLAESGLLWTAQTKSVTLPSNAQNVKVIVEKDLFAGNWRLAYNGTITGASQCIRITGTTFSSKIKPCK